jgi:hypothetical protein
MFDAWAEEHMKEPDYCFYCRGFIRPGHLTRDHFVPRSKRGSNRSHNIVKACRSCNVAKDDLNPITCFNLFHADACTPEAVDNLERLRATVIKRAAEQRYKPHLASFDHHPVVRHGDTQVRITDLLPQIIQLAESAD